MEVVADDVLVLPPEPVNRPAELLPMVLVEEDKLAELVESVAVVVLDPPLDVLLDEALLLTLVMLEDVPELWPDETCVVPLAEVLLTVEVPAEDPADPPVDPPAVLLPATVPVPATAPLLVLVPAPLPLLAPVAVEVVPDPWADAPVASRATLLTPPPDRPPPGDEPPADSPELRDAPAPDPPPPPPPPPPRPPAWLVRLSEDWRLASSSVSLDEAP